jgi:hypothetical protein
VCILYRRQESILRFNLKYGAGKEEKKMAYEAKKQSSETSRHRNYNKIKNYASPARKTPFHLLPARVFGVRLLTPCGFREREVVRRTTMPEVGVVFYRR